MLANLFKPKWQHTNPSTRANAALKLREDNPEQFRILSKLATSDPSQEVREAALSQIEQFDHLIELLNHDTQDSIHFENKIAQQLNESSSPESLIERLRATTSEENAMRIVANSAHATLLGTLVGQIQSEQQLAALATSSAPIAIRKHAAQKIQSTTVIESLLKDTRQSDKAIYRIIKDKLAAAKEAERHATEQTEKAQHIAEQMHTVAHGEWFPLFGATCENLSNEWQDIAAEYRSANTELYEAAESLAQQRIEEHQAAQLAEQRERQDKEAATKQAEQLIGDIQALLSACDPQQLLNHADLRSELNEQLNNIEARWADAQLSGKTQLHKAFSQELEDARQELAKLAECNEKHEQLRAFLAQTQTPEFQQQSEQERLRQAKKSLASAAWPNSLPAPNEVEQLNTLITELQRSREALAKSKAAVTKEINSKLTAFEKAIETGEIKTANKLSRSAQEMLGKLNGGADAHLHQRYRGLQGQLQELKDWQGFAVTPKKEQLCAEMEALAQQDLPPQQKAKQIKKLQQQWRVLDATDPVHSQAIWKRFKAAADLAYAPCEEHFANQGKVRAYNLAQRQTIFDQVTAYLEATDWQNTDWRNVEKVVQTAKEEWRRFIPVDRNPGQKLQDAFNVLLAPVETHLKSIKEEAKQRKLELIEQAAALTTYDDVSAAAQEAKALQQQWKEAGPTFHSQERKLWKAFRDHCDVIFARLQDSLPSVAEQQSAKSAIQNTLASLEASLEKPRHLELVLAEANNLLSTLIDEENITPKDQQRLARAINQLDNERDRLARAFAQNNDHRVLAAPLDEAEEAVLSDNPVDLQAIPQELGSIEPMNLRRENLLAIIDNRALLEDELTQTGVQARELCIRLEILLSEPSPESDEALRMEYQMQRLQQALERQNRSTDLTDLVALEAEWLALPFKGAYPEYQARFEGLFSSLLN
ncbi:DUF349 domain-containing protein [Neptunomonas sp. XY-337]|uniref:DUF349 domain-containing protein n=1 Tax=Neptunomonas sp. XY-337 TaxID=2561897 RepID=UPI0010AA9304|nr:DUF349 domain-containing protein [Neptunomonas sp. XY-337]